MVASILATLDWLLSLTLKSVVVFEVPEAFPCIPGKPANLPLLTVAKFSEPYSSVNAFDFSSSMHKDIFIIGDSTSQSSVGRVPKSGYIANSMGKVCGLAVVAELMDFEKLTPSMINTCYSLVSDEEGISVSAVYSYDENSKKIITTSAGLSPNSSKIIKENAWDWAQNIWEDML